MGGGRCLAERLGGMQAAVIGLPWTLATRSRNTGAVFALQQLMPGLWSIWTIPHVGQILVETRQGQRGRNGMLSWSRVS